MMNLGENITIYIRKTILIIQLLKLVEASVQYK